VNARNLAGARRREVSLVAASFASNGTVVAHSVKEFEIVVDEKKYTELTEKGMEMNLAMPVPTTAARIRVVVRDSSNGNLGTADLTPEGEQFH